MASILVGAGPRACLCGCGSRFVPKRYNHKYYSYNCRQKSLAKARRRKNKPKYERYCLFCLHRFTALRKDKVFCCALHGQSYAHWRRGRERIAAGLTYDGAARTRKKYKTVFRGRSLRRVRDVDKKKEK